MLIAERPGPGAAGTAGADRSRRGPRPLPTRPGRSWSAASSRRAPARRRRSWPAASRSTAGAVDKPGTAVATTPRWPWRRRAELRLARRPQARRRPRRPRGRRRRRLGARPRRLDRRLHRLPAAPRAPRASIALDVGYGQLDWRLRQDPRVARDGAHQRALPRAGRPAVARPTWSRVTSPSSRSARSGARWRPAWRRGWRAMVMVKPQFEVGRERVGSGGVVRDAGGPGGRGARGRRGHRGGGRAGAGHGRLAACPGPKGNREVFVLAAEDARPRERRHRPAAARCPISIEDAKPRGQARAAADPPRARGDRVDACRRSLSILQDAGVEVLVPAGEVVKHRIARAVLLQRRHAPAAGRRGPDPGARRRRQHPARAGAGGRRPARR